MPGVAERRAPRSRFRFFYGLRGRLLLLTVFFVLFAELLIYAPLAATFRTNWLATRAQQAQIASLAVRAAPDGRVSAELSHELLSKAQVVSIAVEGDDFRELVLPPAVPINGPLVKLDMREGAPDLGLFGTFSHLLAPPGRFLQVLVTPDTAGDHTMEIIIPESALRAGIIGFSRTILIASLVICAVVGALIYQAIYRLVVRPMQRLTDGVIAFADAPEGAELQLPPAQTDEMMRAQAALLHMQRQVSASFRQRKRLADLGEAVAKINHDLRNSLAAAQIVSEGLSQSNDPRVQRAAPRLERAIERAIGLAEATLRYGRTEAPECRPVAADILPVIAEAVAEGLANWPQIEWVLDAPAQLPAMIDIDQVHRIVVNLVRNSSRAISEQKNRATPGRITCKVYRKDDCVLVELADNGPGIPEQLKPRMFQPFAASGSRDGAGLGLAIARELARGMKGDLELAHSDSSGATFRLKVPAA